MRNLQILNETYPHLIKAITMLKTGVNLGVADLDSAVFGLNKNELACEEYLYFIAKDIPKDDSTINSWSYFCEQGISADDNNFKNQVNWRIKLGNIIKEIIDAAAKYRTEHNIEASPEGPGVVSNFVPGLYAKSPGATIVFLRESSTTAAPAAPAAVVIEQDCTNAFVQIETPSDIQR
jgi:hypothetical protein